MFEVHDLSFRYGKKEILNGLSFRVGSGQVCGLFGPNGSGKTTLFRACLNFQPYHRGQVRVDGEDLQTKSIEEVARLIAYVPQEHKPPFPYRVKEIVLMGRTPHLGGAFRVSDRDKARALEAMSLLGIAHLADRPYNQISLGQRQLVLIARAVCQDTRLLFLDEPTSALDFSNQILIWRLLRKIARQGTTILVCTHDPNHILWFCDQVIILDHGKIIADGAPRQAVNPQTLNSIYNGFCEVRDVGGISMVVPSEKNQAPNFPDP